LTLAWRRSHMGALVAGGETIMIFRHVFAAALFAGAAAQSGMAQAPSSVAVVDEAGDGLEAARIGGLIDALMLAGMQDYDVAGAAVAITLNGEIVMTRGYGIARIEPEEMPATPDSLFQVASVSKLPVYIAGMQMVEAGKIALDDPINEHLPEALQIPDQGFSEPIRIRDLFAHTAGFEDLALGHLFGRNPADLTRMDGYLVAHRPIRVREPGQFPVYSNYSLILLGRIVEEKSGQPFADYMEARVLRPLGMETASYRDPFPAALAAEKGIPAPLPEALQPRATQQLDGSPGDWSHAGDELTSSTAPAGGMRVSANDMSRFLLALSDPARLEAGGVLKAETFRTMIAGPSVKGAPRVRHGFIPYELPGGIAGIGHGGAMAYSASDLVIVPELGLGVFVSTNTRGGFAFAYDIAARLTEGLSPGETNEPVRTEATKMAAKSLAGAWIDTRRAYRSSETAVMTPATMVSVSADDNGDLLMGGVVGAAQRFVPMGDGRWRPATPGGWSIIATQGADGKTRLVSTSGTGTMERASFWQRAETILLPIILTLITCLLAIYGWPGRWRSQLATRASAEPLPRAARIGVLAADAAVPLWLIGLGAYLITLLGAASDGGAKLLFSWPGAIGWAGWVH
jgi:CubicO group peptidase (beta-lactamase class C family)